MSDRPVCDPSVLARLEELNEPGLPDLVVQLFEDFVRKAPGRLEALGSAFERGSREDAAKAAHQLSSVAAALGFGPLSETCARIEAGHLSDEAARLVRLQISEAVAFAAREIEARLSYNRGE